MLRKPGATQIFIHEDMSCVRLETHVGLQLDAIISLSGVSAEVPLKVRSFHCIFILITNCSIEVLQNLGKAPHLHPLHEDQRAMASSFGGFGKPRVDNFTADCMHPARFGTVRLQANIMGAIVEQILDFVRGLIMHLQEAAVMVDNEKSVGQLLDTYLIAYSV